MKLKENKFVKKYLENEKSIFEGIAVRVVSALAITDALPILILISVGVAFSLFQNSSDFDISFFRSVSRRFVQCQKGNIKSIDVWRGDGLLLDGWILFKSS